MSSHRIRGKVWQLLEVPVGDWQPFVSSWVKRKERGFIECAFPGTGRLVRVPLEDFYKSHSFFIESADGRREMKYFLSKSRPADIFFDIGGFRGAYAAAFKARHSDSGARVFIFEPLPRNYERIEHLRQLNNFANFELISVAVGDGNPLEGGINEVVEMLRSGDAAASLETKVPSCSLEQFCSDRKVEPSLIKIDVDGFEWEVLQGAKNLLQKSRPRLWMEVHPTFLQNKGVLWKDVIRFLESMGYQVTYFSDFESRDRDISFHLWCE